MWKLTKSFRFEAAHTPSGTTFGAASEEIHGHSFRAEVSLRGTPDPVTGMVVELGLLQRAIEDVRLTLDHSFSTRSNHRASRRWKPLAVRLGAACASRRTDPRLHASRQLQRELHLLQSAGLQFVGWAKRSVPTIQDGDERWWGGASEPLPTLRGTLLGERRECRWTFR
jgi:6-pyruvoyl-tetrahydropterin synthase